MTRRRRPTLDDVASAVGVSRATVSNAYNRPDQLSARLRDEVLRVAGELGYPGPDPTARSLATSRTGAVAVLLDTSLSMAFSDPALYLTLDALTRVIDPRGHALLLLPGGPPAERVRTAQADVAIAYSLPDGAPALDAVRARGLPLVVVDQPLLPGTALVGCADRAGAALAARHLLDLGHRRFGIFAACSHVRPGGGRLTVAEAAASPFHDVRERLGGYLDELGSCPVVVEEAGGLSAESAMAGAFALLGASPRPTAVLCMSDQLALAVLAAARELGIGVPGELSVAGFDDSPPSPWSSPPLTTVRQDLATKGRIAGELALAVLDGGSAPAPVEVPVSLVVRGSTGPG
ncbi:LacI family DNA-binding transcriptional regulator [Amycolatopsis sp. lyj-23]|uniref:LacI family DNA-binding transcriptional regulator n=1 Tax=Amycolatopsis sp. lyj-23 TaxID=2789283 RepID=UPI00397E63FA